MNMGKKLQIGIIGSNTSTSSKVQEEFAKKLGTKLIDLGYRIICGGMGGVMEAVCEGAASSSKHQDGDIIGILPSENKKEANPFLDIVIPTGLGFARNQVIIASSDVVVAIGGGAGTLTEIAIAWQMGKPLIGVDLGEGWSSKLVGTYLDNRQSKTIAYARRLDDVLFLIQELIPFEIMSPLEKGTIINSRFVVEDRIRTKLNHEHYLVKDEENDKIHIMKAHIKRTESDWNLFMKERDILLKLDHPGIIKPIHVGEIESTGIKRAYYISPKYEKTLIDLDIESLSLVEIFKITNSIIRTCIYLEDNMIVHKDIKPENIVLDTENNPILIDFYKHNIMETNSVYRTSMKEEDMYNMGKILLYMFSGRRIYKMDISLDIEDLLPDLSEERESILELLRQMMNPDIKLRPDSFYNVHEQIKQIVKRLYKLLAVENIGKYRSDKVMDFNSFGALIEEMSDLNSDARISIFRDPSQSLKQPSLEGQK